LISCRLIGAVRSLTGGRTPNEPAVIIHIFKAQPGAPLPPGGWGVPGAPYPEGIQQVFAAGDKMYIGLRISRDIETNITFSKFTYFNKETGNEVEVGSASDLMRAWEPGQVDFLAFDNPWSVPEEPGYYQLNAYVDSEVVASALFQVE